MISGQSFIQSSWFEWPTWNSNIELTLTHMWSARLLFGNGLAFTTFLPFFLQMVLGGPSAFLRNLFPTEEPCECNTLTVMLPDFDSKTIKNLLGLLYTGMKPAIWRKIKIRTWGKKVQFSTENGGLSLENSTNLHFQYYINWLLKFDELASRTSKDLNFLPCKNNIII